jgi:hypothetical protein
VAGRNVTVDGPQRRYARERARRLREPDTLYKLNRGCDLCGFNTVPDALQYHHRNPDTKTGHVSQMILKKGADWEGERDKCNLLCANCHWTITASIRI